MDVLLIEWLFYYRRCLFSGSELHARYDWQVMSSSMYCSLFLIHHLCILRCITWKLQVVHGHSTYWMTALLLETFLVWFRVAWEIQLESCGPRHASWLICNQCSLLISSLLVSSLVFSSLPCFYVFCRSFPAWARVVFLYKKILPLVML